MSDEPRYTLGSGNVFADLDYVDADEALLKAMLAREISAAIQEKNLTPAEAALLLGLDQPSMSAVTRGRLAAVSVERLLRCLTALERDVTITVGPKKRERGRIELVSGA
jgi:predicted XRE-type DNA-binding protein